MMIDNMFLYEFIEAFMDWKITQLINIFLNMKQTIYLFQAKNKVVFIYQLN